MQCVWLGLTADILTRRRVGFAEWPLPASVRDGGARRRRPTWWRQWGARRERGRRGRWALTATWSARRWAAPDWPTCSSRRPGRHWAPPRRDADDAGRPVTAAVAAAAACLRCSTPRRHCSAGGQRPSELAAETTDRSVASFNDCCV